MAEPRSGSSAKPPAVSMAAGMAAAADADKGRHPYGPRALSVLVPGLLRPSFARQPAATAQLMADWRLIAGEKLATLAAPRKLAAGTLTIACSGPTAMELQHAGDMLVTRINQHLGSAVVQRLRIVQEPVHAATPVAAPRTRPNPTERAAAAKKLSQFPEGPLRDALAGLAAALQQR